MSRASSVSWILFYGLFMIYALAQQGSFLWIDVVNLITHEGGHLLFGWLGPRLGIWGGTLLQLGVPLLLAGYFYSHAQITGFTFCMFFLFENLLYTATYMCDARIMALPLVSAGSSDYIEHDWHTIFTSMGVLQYDSLIGNCVRVLGWSGMLTTGAWFYWRTRKMRFA